MSENIEPSLTPTWFVDSDAPEIVALSREVVGNTTDEIERACRLFYAVRDGIRYTAYNLDLRVDGFRATNVLASGQSWCVPKSVLLAALCRAAGVPCRLGYANVCNHMATQKLLDFLGTNVFYYHGYNELYLRGKWVKATVAFNRTLCEKARLAPLDFDGVHDSLYHPFDLAGHRYMEYVHDYGPFTDVPYQAIIEKFHQVYPNMRPTIAGGAALSGDFEAEIQAEASRQ
ncbi:MAG: transglutaminase domain-containing protein [Planctomycetia bacterium]|nr:transglutaminase domain-containing protein [Planctomycetia bacterium]